MGKSGVNPIAERSKKWLAESLVRLMEQKHYKDISIKELVDEADLSRRTYYRNFESKDEILNFYFEMLFEEYLERLCKEMNPIEQNLTKVFMGFWVDHKSLLINLQKFDLLHILVKPFYGFAKQVYRVFEYQFDFEVTDDQINYLIAQSIGGYWSVLVLWLEEGAVKSPDQVEALLTFRQRK